MGFGKKEKIQKTQYETENQNLGRAAYPKIQPALDRVGDLTMNPDEYRKNLIDTYYNSDNSAQWSDAQRNIRRNLSNATANNYAATHGGYSSAGQKYYDDVTRAMNDYNSRLWDYGVNSANNMYNSDLANTSNYYKTLLGTHQLAEQGDAIDNYNELVDKQNKQWWANALNEIGSGVEALAPGPWKAIGTGMRVGAWAGSKDYGDAMAMRGKQIGLSGDPDAYRSGSEDLGGIVSSGINNWMNWGGAKSPTGGSSISSKAQSAADKLGVSDEYASIMDRFDNFLTSPYKRKG